NIWAVLNDRVLSRVPAGSDLPEAFPTPSVPQAIKTLLVDRQDSLWLGTDGGDVFRMRNGSLKHELSLGPGIESISALFEDSKGNLWIGFTGGAGVAMLPEGDPARWHVIEGMPYPDVRSIAEAADGTMWFGTHYGGAFRWKDGKWTGLTTHDGL